MNENKELSIDFIKRYVLIPSIINIFIASLLYVNEIFNMFSWKIIDLVSQYNFLNFFVETEDGNLFFIILIFIFIAIFNYINFIIQVNNFSDKG